MTFLVLGFFESEVSAIGALGDLERFRRRGRRPAAVVEIRRVGRVLTGVGSDQLPRLSAADRLMVSTRVRAGQPALVLVVDARPEVGMASVTDPKLMMLDEPASGLSRGERERLTELLLGYVASDRFALRQEDPVQ